MDDLSAHELTQERITIWRQLDSAAMEFHKRRMVGYRLKTGGHHFYMANTEGANSLFDQGYKLQ